MVVRIPPKCQNAMSNGFVDLLDAGGAAGSIELYTGAQPVLSTDAASGTLLSTFLLALPACGDAAAGVATLNGVPITATAVATGEAGWFRLLDSNGDPSGDGNVADGNITLSTTSIVADGAVQLMSGRFPVPSS